MWGMVIKKQKFVNHPCFFHYKNEGLREICPKLKKIKIFSIFLKKLLTCSRKSCIF